MTLDSPPPDNTPSTPESRPSWRQWWTPWLMPVAIAGALGAGWVIAEFASGPEQPTQPTSGDVSLPVTTELPPTQPANLLEAPDKSSQVVLPKGWEPASNLNPQAQIQAENSAQQIYLIVRAQPKAELGALTKEQFSERSRQLLTEQLTQVEQKGPSDRITKVGSYPALQYEIRGSLNSIGVVYLHTIVETPEYFTQILTWTAPANFQKNEAEMQNLIQGVELK
ncbi:MULTISPECIES: hypothetical protein [unclassified Leptolyngbya]|uniref:hypothetical protein n=1 Tax=unclassified Leptolyngbya TaxID=2650499 RepID=UPI001688907C|nr:MULTISPECIES: hypothetical protein [unclassified Leptolyngbya]MBD1911801.1 hypothetical protein [Leptolyngbya sp. FACHB-8]MBD2153309.1 hypothetical protein [Leptolyngbya sp. FACHB-16]